MPDREISKNRLTFQRYLINEYVLKPQKLIKKDFDEKRGFSVIVPSKDQADESRESEEVKRTSKDSAGSGNAGY